MVPGWFDAHVHFIWWAEAMARLDVSDTTSVEEALDRIASRARTLPAGAWILGGRFDKNNWGRWPTAVDLDRVTGGRPAVLRSRDGHSRWLNSAAIARAGITRDTATPEGGAIFRDDRGEATGVLQENANALADGVIPAPTDAEMLADARRGQIEAWRRGITGLEDCALAQAGKCIKPLTRSKDEVCARWKADRPQQATLVHSTAAGGCDPGVSGAGANPGERAAELISELRSMLEPLLTATGGQPALAEQLSSLAGQPSLAAQPAASEQPFPAAQPSPTAPR